MQSFDPYSPPEATLVRRPTVPRAGDWVYPLTLSSTPSWLMKLRVELRDAIGRAIVSTTARWQLWEIFGFRLVRKMNPDLPPIQVRPRLPLKGWDLQILDEGKEIAALRNRVVVSPWVVTAPGGVWLSIRPYNPLARWLRRTEPGSWPGVAQVGEQLDMASEGYPIMTVHAGPDLPPFLVVRRLFSGLAETTRVERLEGEVSPETEWLALQMLAGAYLCRIPGIG